jgi:hypothetical protein
MKPVLSINCHFSKYVKEINSKSIIQLFAKKPQKIIAISKNVQHTKIHKKKRSKITQGNTIFKMDICTQFSPCTGPLINKINNGNILRN